ncbi:MAG: hypothetical protein BSOLF_2339 [Candidatus Carbobacillus altaicus]|uniref:Uncharacterized protein n=1 Tax=Candidatus Carbonibacillus altaicus TaxID=2163959 RepID=A0A2R6XY77_9BACL|nr:MAG: hypothetical protein BSOLF_2339 [Candidatus Carbobacillus altaicus]
MDVGRILLGLIHSLLFLGGDGDPRHQPGKRLRIEAPLDAHMKGVWSKRLPFVIKQGFNAVLPIFSPCGLRQKKLKDHLQKQPFPSAVHQGDQGMLRSVLIAQIQKGILVPFAHIFIPNPGDANAFHPRHLQQPLLR